MIYSNERGSVIDNQIQEYNNIWIGGFKYFYENYWKVNKDNKIQRSNPMTELDKQLLSFYNDFKEILPEKEIIQLFKNSRIR